MGFISHLNGCYSIFKGVMHKQLKQFSTLYSSTMEISETDFSDFVTTHNDQTSYVKHVLAFFMYCSHAWRCKGAKHNRFLANGCYHWLQLFFFNSCVLSLYIALISIPSNSVLWESLHHIVACSGECICRTSFALECDVTHMCKCFTAFQLSDE